MKKILGFESAKAEAKRIGRNNMMISACLVLELCEEIERLSAELDAESHLVSEPECLHNGEWVDAGHDPMTGDKFKRCCDCGHVSVR